jgi:thioredoxin reductase/NAD-dependent dihydropyrimidine dehydrogenase PreA subunit
MLSTALIWLAIFVVLAFLATIPVHFHLAAMRKTQGAGGGSRKPASARAKSTRPCPQCGHPTASDSAFCEKCGVPMMLWQLKLSREVTGNEKSNGGGHPLPIIDQDVCIGCSACVNACEQSVLEIVAGKSTVVNIDACNGPAACAEVCPTGACQLTGQGSARRVEVPRIGANFETDQKGIYAIGELGGLGLIKNAVNEGQLVIEAIKRSHVKREGVVDLIFVGAGPAGLSGSLAAKEAGLSSLVFEQGSFADTIRRFPNRKIVMAEPVKVPMYGSLWISDAPKETLLSVWQTIIESAQIPIKENEQVLGIRRNGNDTFHVETKKGTYECQKVVLAIGKRGSPRRLEVKGSELPKVMYALTDTAQYKRSNVLVVGGGDSAAEAAIGLANQDGNHVSLSYRKKDFSRMKDRNRAGLRQAIQEGRVRFFPCSQIVEVAGKEVLIQRENGGTERLPNDFIFALLGGTPPNAFLESIGVSMVTKEVSVPA